MTRYTWQDIKNSSKSRDGILSILLYRKVATVLTYLFGNIVRLSPNQISTLSLISWISTAILIVYGQFEVAAGLTFLGFVLDCTDGNIARLTGRTSDKGKIYDSLVDRVCFYAIVWALALSMARASVGEYMIPAVTAFTIMGILNNIMEFRRGLSSNKLHEVPGVAAYEQKIKRSLRKVLPFLNWNNVILGIGADILWSLLIISIIINWIFYYFLLAMTVLYFPTLFLLLKNTETSVAEPKKKSDH